jgi:GH24 family phage-related lysozyme (muramidase)
MPKINAAGLAIVKQYEGCELSAYADPGTGGEPWTIGYGHTDPGIVTLGMTITQDQADELLEQDLAKFETCVNEACARAINSNQFSALVSFAYNVGCEAMEGSTLMKMVNAGDFAGAAGQFGLWVNDPPLPGLVTRRAAEKTLFETP